MVRRPALAAVLCALAVAGCGEQEDPAITPGMGEDYLAAVDIGRLEEAQEQVELLCRGIEEPPPRIEAAVERVENYVRESPDKLFQSGSVRETKSVRRFAAQLARRLAECGAEEPAAELRRTLREVG